MPQHLGRRVLVVLLLVEATVAIIATRPGPPRLYEVPGAASAWSDKQIRVREAPKAN